VSAAPAGRPPETRFGGYLEPGDDGFEALAARADAAHRALVFEAEALGLYTRDGDGDGGGGA
jgi:hypothetical protein